MRLGCNRLVRAGPGESCPVYERFTSGIGGPGKSRARDCSDSDMRPRIVTVYRKDLTPHDRDFGGLAPVSMTHIRRLRISEELVRRGFDVDMAVPDEAGVAADGRHPSVARVRLSEIDWRGYDVVKTLYHRGYETLEEYGGAGHPFVISRLASVVGPRDMKGIHFHGAVRERLYATQQRIARSSRYVSLTTPAACELWSDCFGPKENVLLVPGAVDREIPPPAADPYPRDGLKRVLFAGNVYPLDLQPEANRTLLSKLNQLGRLLARRRARLYMMGPGDVSLLDTGSVTYLGAVPYEATWDYFHYADVGVVVSAGSFMHNNESTKIYHYLRAGLPVVSEAGFPNDHVLTESGLGLVVPEGNLALLAEGVDEAASRAWSRDAAIDYVSTRHTWSLRVGVYEALLAKHFGG
jgi:glycosyltransferase involved in cell wall biosynthesis